MRRALRSAFEYALGWGGLLCWTAFWIYLGYHLLVDLGLI